ncbi:MAG: acyl-ACP--UDP-N-acetylglucosamine O-acyltransferase [Verrucomicrobia bacterium]|nr:acyl-ACP--UDP-N-acetylglucosamine O-acyltransferase [Verrucomicrobiota bacterium]MDA1004979.1 acyl-ACP--UDP-N-acetylglucosamine O-acyltransferase [Verrucomicrobiota bacterium]
MPSIHPTAIISDTAQLAPDVTVGPHTLIDGPAVIGPGCTIGANAWIAGRVTMGTNNHIGHGAVVGSDPQSLTFDPATETGVVLGNRNTLREYVTIHRATAPGTDTILGDNNFLMTGVHLAHDVRLGNSNILANNALLAGHIQVGNNVFIGGSAVCHQFLHVGDLAMIAGNAPISKDVPPYCMATREDTVAGLNIVGLRRAGLNLEQRTELKRLYRILFQRPGTLAEAIAEASKTTWSQHAAKLLAAVTNPSKRGVLSH